MVKDEELIEESLDFEDEEEKEIELNMLRERAKKSEAVTDEEWMSINKYNRQSVEEFLQESTHLSKESMKQYTSALKIFYVWVEESLRGKNFYEIKKKDFMRFQNALVRRGMSSNGIKMKRSAISSMNKYFINYYEDEPEFETFRNFVEGVKPPTKNKVYNKIPLSKEEFELILKTLEEDGQWQILAGMHFLYASGCRRAELLQLKKEIVNYSPIQTEPNIYQTHDVRTKGEGEQGLVRKLVFDDRAKKAMEKWLEVRGDDKCPYLFVSHIGDKIQKLNITAPNYWCSEIISDIIGRRVNPHLIRGTRSTHILQEGKDISKAKALLGHKDVSTTQQFYDLREVKEDLSDIF